MFCFYSYRIYFDNLNVCDDTNLKISNPKLKEYEERKNLMIIFVCDIFLDDPKVSEMF